MSSMSTRTQVIGLLIAAFMLVIVLELVRRRRLRIGYSLTWLIIGVGAMILIAVPPVLRLFAYVLGVSDPRSLLFAAASSFAFWILLDHSLTLTKLWRQDKDMAQQSALLEWRVRQLESQLDELTAAHLELLESRPVDWSSGQREAILPSMREDGHALSYQLEREFDEPQA